MNDMMNKLLEDIKNVGTNVGTKCINGSLLMEECTRNKTNFIDCAKENSSQLSEIVKKSTVVLDSPRLSSLLSSIGLRLSSNSVHIFF